MAVLSNKWNNGKSPPIVNWPKGGFKVLFSRCVKNDAKLSLAIYIHV